jgi:hypothetical protein
MTLNPEDYYGIEDELFPGKTGGGSGGKKKERSPTSKTSQAARNRHKEEAMRNRHEESINAVAGVVENLVRGKSPQETEQCLGDYIAWVNLCLQTGEVDIDESDLKVETFRSGGAGGQNVNKVSSGARVRHHITGIFVESSQERDQPKNIEEAKDILNEKLRDHLGNWRTILQDGDPGKAPRELTREDFEKK